MRKLGFSMIALTLLLAGGCGSKEWKPYTSQEGGFTAMFPGEPAKANDGDIQMYAASVSGGEVTVMYTKMDVVPKDHKEQMQVLHTSRDAAMEPPMSMRSSTDGTFQGCPSIDYTGVDSSTDEWMYARSFIKGDRLYFVAYGGPKAFFDSPEAKRFMDSFKLN